MRLKQFNDWGAIYYAVASKGLSRQGFANTRRGVKLKERQPVRVTWPNGVIEDLRLKSHPHREHINDMGHEYNVDTKLWGIDARLHGLAVWVPVEDVDIELPKPLSIEMEEEGLSEEGAIS